MTRRPLPSSLRLWVLTLVVFNLSLAMNGQSSGGIEGRVTDPGNFPLQDVIVSIPGTSIRTTTDRKGEYRLPGMPAGEYDLSASYLGLQRSTKTVSVNEGTVTTADFALGVDGAIFELDELEVLNYSGNAQAAALSQQRAANNITNVIASDAIGNFPDSNAAEALQRLPGISIENQRGEGRFLIVRGAAPNYNSITMDGAAVLSSERDGRTVSLDVYPAEQIARIEVTKAITPDLPGDSIGGSVNLVTKRAFDFGKRNINANAFLAYNDLAEDFGYRTGVTYSEILGASEDWGIQISAQSSERVSLEHSNEIPLPRNRTINFADEGMGTYTIADRLVQTQVGIERTRQSFSGTLERRFGDKAYYFIRATMNKFIEDNDRPLHQINLASSRFSNPVEDEDGKLVSVTNNRLTGRRQGNTRTFEDTYQGLAIGGEWFGDNYRLNAQVSYSLAQNTQDSIRGEFNTIRYEKPFTVDFSDPLFPRLDAAATAYVNSPENFVLGNVRVNDRDVDHGEWSFNADYKHYGRMGATTFTWKLGVQARLAFMDSFENEIDHRGFDDGSITELKMTDPRVGFYAVADDFLEGRYVYGPSPIDAAFSQLFTENPEYFGEPDNNIEEYNADEDIYASYLMGTWEWERLTLVAGARMEHTRVEYDDGGVVTDRPDNVQDLDPSGNYTNVLPSVHLRYQISEPLIFRLAWSNSIARPEFNRMAPFEVISVDSLTGDVFIRRGNPNLEAVESMNWDLLLEYFTEKGGVLSAGIFYKEIDGPIYRSVLSDRVEDITVTVESFYNAGKATLLGAEVNYQTHFTRLPDWWSGFGMMVNATITTSDVDIPQRPAEEFPLFRQSDFLGNFAIFYQKFGWNIRLSYNWRSGFLKEVGNSANLDLYETDYARLDFQAAYKFNKHWRIQFEATNLTDEPEFLESGGVALPSFYGLTGRTYSLGVQWSY